MIYRKNIHPDNEDMFDFAAKPVRQFGNPEFASLFSGAMGLDIGFEKAGFAGKGCVEWDRSAAESIRANRPHIPVINEDIRKVSVRDAMIAFGYERGAPLAIIGGPPCQAFSVMGKRRGAGDSRGQMSYEFVRFIREIQPEFFVMENVRGLLSMAGENDKSHGGMIRELANMYLECGYKLDIFVVNSVNYGCPQTRERVLVFGNRMGLKIRFPEPTHGPHSKKQAKFATLADALRDVRDEKKELLDFSPRKKRYLEQVPAGGNWRSLPEEIQRESMGKAWHLKGGRSAYWRRLSWSSPSPTLVTMPNHASTSLCHPDETRVLSVAEYASIQQFPSDWLFRGSIADKYKQIGNAVPTVLGEMAGRAILNAIECCEPRSERSPDVNEVHIWPHVRVNQYFRDGEAFASRDYGLKR